MTSPTMSRRRRRCRPALRNPRRRHSHSLCAAKRHHRNQHRVEYDFNDGREAAAYSYSSLNVR